MVRTRRFKSRENAPDTAMPGAHLTTNGPGRCGASGQRTLPAFQAFSSVS
jgi:hypothetical protein